MTTFENKCNILAQLWIDYRDDQQFQSFIAYNDLGLPLAYAVNEGIVENTELSKTFIEEAFELFLGIMEIEDKEYETLDDILGS